jgi:mono/diheme cytochrome c family protein
MKRKTAVLVAVAMIVCVSAVAQSSSEALYNTACAKCHGNDGKGSKSTKMHVGDLQSKTIQAMTDEQLYESIAIGIRHKEYPHAYLNRGLMKEQVQDLVKYIRTLGGKKSEVSK